MTFPSEPVAATRVQTSEMLLANDPSEVDASASSRVIIPAHVDFKARPNKCVRFCLDIMIASVPFECVSRRGFWAEDAAREEREAQEMARAAAAAALAQNAKKRNTVFTDGPLNTHEKRHVTHDLIMESVSCVDTDSVWDECFIRPSFPTKKRSRLEALYMGGSQFSGPKVPTASDILSFVDFKHPLVASSDVPANTINTTATTTSITPSSVGFHQNCTRSAPCPACDPKSSWIEYMLAVSELECRRIALTSHVTQQPLCC
eukprot:comp21044_c0_seq1/m.28292 comp21044_c0_seq1/g.28292  ORF comp21044_c0_seq1/g.28292 comp21044_c0_seq1/m.28292 type:complete len:261 (-) comp21044_c0_seq1:318-1100(-)